jgi:hypothetical protein
MFTHRICVSIPSERKSSGKFLSIYQMTASISWKTTDDLSAMTPRVISDDKPANNRPVDGS